MRISLLFLVALVCAALVANSHALAPREGFRILRDVEHNRPFYYQECELKKQEEARKALEVERFQNHLEALKSEKKFDEIIDLSRSESMHLWVEFYSEIRNFLVDNHVDVHDADHVHGVISKELNSIRQINQIISDQIIEEVHSSRAPAGQF